MASVLVKEPWTTTTEVWEVTENTSVLQQVSTAPHAFPCQGKLQIPRTAAAMRVREGDLSSFWIPDVKVSSCCSHPSHLIENPAVLWRLTSAIPTVISWVGMCPGILLQFSFHIFPPNCLWHFSLPLISLISLPCLPYFPSLIPAEFTSVLPFSSPLLFVFLIK